MQRAYRNEMRVIWRLAWPAIISQLLQISAGTLDTIMTGHYNHIDTSAVASGFMLAILLMVFTMGIFFAIQTLAAHQIAEKRQSFSSLLLAGIIIAVVMSLVHFFYIQNISSYLQWMNTDPSIRGKVIEYVQIVSYGLPFFLFFAAFRFLYDGLGNTRIGLYANLAALAVNFVGNYALISGNWGFAPLGSKGAAIATLLSWVTMFLFILIFTLSVKKYRQQILCFQQFNFSEFKTVLRIGVPSGGSLLAEFAFFAALTMAAATMNPMASAAHQFVLNFASLTFMVPLGLSLAITTRVGFLEGAGKLRLMRISVRLAVIGAVCFMTLSSVALFTAPGMITSLYTKTSEVAQIAIMLFPIAALFQIFDGIQVVCNGILKGLKDTLAGMWIALFAYFVLGLGLAFYMAFSLNWGIKGLWYGSIIGLFSAATLMALRTYLKVFRNSKK